MFPPQASQDLQGWESLLVVDTALWLHWHPQSCLCISCKIKSQWICVIRNERGRSCTRWGQISSCWSKPLLPQAPSPQQANLLLPIHQVFPELPVPSLKPLLPLRQWRNMNLSCSVQELLTFSLHNYKWKPKGEGGGGCENSTGGKKGTVSILSSCALSLPYMTVTCGVCRAWCCRCLLSLGCDISNGLCTDRDRHTHTYSADWLSLPWFWLCMVTATKSIGLVSELIWRVVLFCFPDYPPYLF